MKVSKILFILRYMLITCFSVIVLFSPLLSCRQNTPETLVDYPDDETKEIAEYRLIPIQLSGFGSQEMRGSGSESGCFALEYSSPFTCNLVVYDYEKLKKENLAVIENQEEGTDAQRFLSVPIAVGNTLYCFQLALPESGFSSGFFRMDLDGSNQQFFTLNDSEALMQGNAVFDGSFLYFVTQDTGNSNAENLTLGKEKYFLTKADPQSGEFAKVAALSDGDRVRIVGTYSDGFILMYENNSTSGSEHELLMDASHENQFQLFSLSENKLIAMYPFWEIAKHTLSFVVGKDKIYFIYDEYAALNCYDIPSDTVSVMDVDLRLGLENVTIHLRDLIRDNHLQFFVSDLEDTYYYALDLTANTCIKLDLPYSPEDYAYVYIMDETQDDFLVQYKYSDKTLTYDYALISKSDFWKSVPNYRPIR